MAVPKTRGASSEKNVTDSSTQRAGADETPLSTIPKIEAHANLVLVDVVVTSRGRHVKGLTASDFKVYDNGRQQPLTVFEEHTAETPIHAKAGRVQPKLPPGVYSDQPKFPDRGVATVLLLDGLNTPLTDQVYLRKQLVNLLERIPHNMPLAIFTLGTRMRMVQGFNANTGALVAAMQGRKMVRASTVLHPEFEDALERETQDIIELGATQSGLMALRQFEADQTSTQTDLRVKITLGALDGLAAYLRLIPGRKNLIWVSGSFPFAIYRDDTLEAPLEPEREYAPDLAWTAALMSAARVAVYPVNADGLDGLPSTSAMESSSDASNVMNNDAINALAGGGKDRNGMNLTASTAGGVRPGTFAEPSMAQADLKFMERKQSELQSMQALAQATGGQVFTGTNDIGKAVSEAMRAGEDYYTVGYVPEFRQHDESFHRLKVVMPNGDHADYRTGYYADTAAVDPHAGHAQMAAAILDDGPPVSDLPFEVKMQPVVEAAGTAAGKEPEGEPWQVEYSVPVQEVDFEPAAGGNHLAKLEVVAVAYDADGRNLNFADERAEVRLPAKFYQREAHSAMPIRQKIVVPRGTVQVRVVVHDLQDGKIGATQIPVLGGSKAGGD
ncbi:MAG: VWA domain-containing protein [Acidobacteriaceae bacterium]